MLKINKSLKLPLVFSILGISGVFLYQYLTFIPEYSNATTIETPVYAEKHPNLSDISTMQEMTAEICNNTPEHYSKPLTDTRDSQSYQVTKLKGTVGCWMTQNMDNATYRMYHHNTYGGYYDWANAKTVCDFTGWELPSQIQYQNLIDTYNASNNGAALTRSPLNFQYGGESTGGFPSNTGKVGCYWSSIPIASYAYNLGFNSNIASINNNVTPNGYSVRCVATGDITSYQPEVITPDSNISVTVPSIIILDVYSENEDNNTVDININNNGAGEGNFTAKVSSNSSYNLSLSTVDGGHTDLRNDNTNSSIPALSTTPPIITTNDSKWWGIKCTNNPSDSTNCKQTNYAGLTDYLTPTLFYVSTQGANNNLTNFTIGIQTSPDLPSGTYSTSILVTASQN